MKVEQLAADGVRDRLDEEGRPLGEQSSPLYAPNEVRCPYSGTRSGGSMNPEALAQITTRWPEVLADLGSLQAGDGTVRGAWRACLAAVVRPNLAIGPIPVLHAATYKAALGFAQVLTFLLLADDDMGTRPLRDLGTSRQMAQQIEAGGWLIGHAQVCAGSPAAIEQMAEALAHPPDAPPRPPDLDAWVDAAGELIAQVLAELERRRLGPASDGLASQVLSRGRPSWIRAVTMAPDRRASDARRLGQLSHGVAGSYATD